MFEGLDLTRIPDELLYAECSRREGIKRAEAEARDAAEKRVQAEKTRRDQTIPLLDRDQEDLIDERYRLAQAGLRLLANVQETDLFPPGFLDSPDHQDFVKIVTHVVQRLRVVDVSFASGLGVLLTVNPELDLYQAIVPPRGNWFERLLTDQPLAISMTQDELNQDILATYKKEEGAVGYTRPQVGNKANIEKATARLQLIAASL